MCILWCAWQHWVSCQMPKSNEYTSDPSMVPNKQENIFQTQHSFLKNVSASVENVPTSNGSILHPPRGSQVPYTPKSDLFEYHCCPIYPIFRVLPWHHFEFDSLELTQVGKCFFACPSKVEVLRKMQQFSWRFCWSMPFA